MKKWNLENVNGLINDLSKFADKMQKKHAGAAVKRGANIVKEHAVKRAKEIDIKDPVGQEESKIYKHIKARHAPKMGRARKGVAYRVGVVGGAETRNKRGKKGTGEKTPRNPPTYWRHVEFGTEDTPAKPFMRPAIEENIDEVEKAMIDTLRKRLFDEADKI